MPWIMPGHSLWALEGDHIEALPRWPELPERLAAFVQNECRLHGIDFNVSGVRLDVLARICQGPSEHEMLPLPEVSPPCALPDLNCFTDGSVYPSQKLDRASMGVGI